MADEIPSDDEILGSLTQTPAAPASPAPTPEAAPQEPAFNPQEWGFKFRNDTVYPKDRQEAIELMQFGRSLRENKPKWEPILQRWEQNKDTYQRYDELSQAIAQNPQFAQELQALAQKYSQPKPQPETSPQPGAAISPEVKKELDDLKAWREQETARQADSELKTELDTLQSKFPRYDWKSDSGEGNLRQQLLQYMQKNHVYDSEIALKAMMYGTDIKQAQMDAERKAAEDAAKQKKLGVVPAGTQPAPAPTARQIDPRNYSYDQLEDMALQSVGQTR